VRARSRSFLLWASGVDLKLLTVVPEETSRFLGLGSANLMSAAVAGTGMAFALTFTGVWPWLAVLGAIMWFAIETNLNRMIAASVQGSTRGLASRLFIVLPRLVLGLLFGTVTSVPLVLRIFEPAINAELGPVEQNAGLLARLQALDAITERSQVALGANFTLLLFFLVIDLLPVLLTLLGLFAPPKRDERAGEIWEDTEIKRLALDQAREERRQMSEDELEYQRQLAEMLERLGPPGGKGTGDR